MIPSTTRSLSRNLLRLLMPALCISSAVAQSPFPFVPNTDIITPNGPIRTMARSGDRLFLGGRFTGVAGFNSGSAALDPVTGRARAGFPLFRSLAAVVDDGSGECYAVDNAITSTVGPRHPMRLMHLSPDGAILVLGYFHAAIYSIARAGGEIWLAGEYDNLNGQHADGLVGVDQSTGAIRTMPTLLPSRPERAKGIRAIGGTDRSLFVSSYNASLGLPFEIRDGLAEISFSSGRAAAWHPRFVSTTLDTAGAAGTSFPAVYPLHYVTGIAVAGSRLYAGGQFDSVDGARRSRLAAFNLQTNRLLPWNPDVVGRRVDLGGSFDTIGGIARSGFAIVDAVTGATIDAGPTFNHYAAVRSIAVDAGHIYISGVGLGEPATTNTRVSGLAAFSRDRRRRLGRHDSRQCRVHRCHCHDARQWTTLCRRSILLRQVDCGACHLRCRHRPVASAGAPMRGSIPGGTPELRSLVVSGDTLYAGGAFSYLATGYNMLYLLRLDPAGASSVRIERSAAARPAVHPNPARSSITIDCSGIPLPAYVTISDMLGNRIIERETSEARSEISVDGLAPGIYMVKVGASWSPLVIAR